MKLDRLRSGLEKADGSGIWAFHTHTLKLMFPEDEATFHKGLDSGIKAGLIRRVCRGVYYNPRALSRPPEPLAALVPMIRPLDFNYLSLETVASEQGAISQLPNRLTVMSSGRSTLMETPLGLLEFVHTERDARDDPRISYDARRGLCVADLAVALRDLRRCKRSTDLIRDPKA